MVTLNLTKEEAKVIRDHLEALDSSCGDDLVGYGEVVSILDKLRTALNSGLNPGDEE